jgi:hypothetical protein
VFGLRAIIEILHHTGRKPHERVAISSELGTLQAADTLLVEEATMRLFST